MPELWRVPFLGSTEAPRGERLDCDRWSPDGRQMAFVRVDAAANSSALVIANADGSSERVLTTRRFAGAFVSLFSGGVSALPPGWSPDGRVIAVFEGQAGPGRRSSLSTWPLALKSCAIPEAASCRTA